MEQSQYSNKIQFYGKTTLLKGKIKPIKRMVSKIASDHHLQIGAIEFNLISDQQLLEININSLSHNYYTDIITFDYNEGGVIIGDIYISIDRIKENAIGFKTTAMNELLRVIFHGVLHLVGYKDKIKSDKIMMTRMENKYLKAFEKAFHVEL